MDNLTSIDMSTLTKSVQDSCCLVLFLDDETHLSHCESALSCIFVIDRSHHRFLLGVRAEIDTARKLQRSIVTVINQDKFVERTLIDQYRSLGYGFIFRYSSSLGTLVSSTIRLLHTSEQVVGYSTAYRQVETAGLFNSRLVIHVCRFNWTQASYDKLMGSIRRAVAKCQSMPVTAPDTVVAESPAAAPHTNESVEEQFKRRVLERYSSVEEAWKAFDNFGEATGKLTRSDFKGVVSSLLGMKITKSEQGKLRKELDKRNTKLISESDFKAFFGHVPNASVASTQSQQAVVPIDCPQLPDAYRSRPEIEKSIVDLLVGRSKSKSARIVAVGMVSLCESFFRLLTYSSLLFIYQGGVGCVKKMLHRMLSLTHNHTQEELH